MKEHMHCSPSSGGSQLTLASQWESRKVMTSPLAAEAPSRRVLMSPSLFLVLRIRTFGIRCMYSSSGTFRCSAESTERQIISITRYIDSGFSQHLESKPGERVEWWLQESSVPGRVTGRLLEPSSAMHGRSQPWPWMSWGFGTAYRLGSMAFSVRFISICFKHCLHRNDAIIADRIEKVVGRNSVPKTELVWKPLAGESRST